MKSIMRVTQVQVTMSLQTDNAGLEMILLLLAGVVYRLWLKWSEVVLLVNDLSQAIDFTVKVFTIGLRSLAYGVVGV